MRIESRCPSGPELSKAMSEGVEPWMEAHVKACAPCGEEWRKSELIREAARALPWAEVDLEGVHTFGATLVHMQRPRAPSTTVRVAGITAIAAATLMAFWVGHESGGAEWIEADPPKIHRATVASKAGSQFVHFTRKSESHRSDEMVRVRTGRLRVSVEKLRQGERFRVIASDAEVEVRGTEFEVVVVKDSLVAVHV